MVNSVHTKRYRALIAVLVDARKAKGFSQAELAEMLGRVQTFVSKYERRERRLDLVEFIDVADALEIDVVKIIRNLKSADEA